jgi:hypothetical protein
VSELSVFYSFFGTGSKALQILQGNPSLATKIAFMAFVFILFHHFVLIREILENILSTSVLE